MSNSVLFKIYREKEVGVVLVVVGILGLHIKSFMHLQNVTEMEIFFINPKQHSCHDEDLHRNCFHLFVCAAQLRSLVLEMQRFNGSNRANWSVFDSWCVLRLTDYNNQRLRSVSGCVRLYNLIP